MPFRHLLIALVIVALWGFNFVFIKWALVDVPPFTLGALRFLLTALPFIFFIPRPKVPWKYLIAYGVMNFGFQFSFLFLGMKLGMSPALSSMIVQTQVFFTMVLASIFLREKISFLKIFGAVIAFCGVAIVGLHSGQDVNIVGLILLLAGAFSWSSGNIISKSFATANSFAIVVWGCAVAAPILMVIALVTEGRQAFINLKDISSLGMISVAYIAYASTHVGYSLWSWLLAKYSASTIAPFSLLVPVFGFLGAALIVGEEIPDWKILAVILVAGGLCVNIYASRRLLSK